MKTLTTLITTALFLTIAAFASAEGVEAGSIYVQGEFFANRVAINTTTLGPDSPQQLQSAFNLSPTVGLFLSDRIALEGVFGYSRINSSYDDTATGTELNVTTRVIVGRVQALYQVPVSVGLSIYGVAGVGGERTDLTGNGRLIVGDIPLMDVGLGSGLLFASGEGIGVMARFEARLDHLWGHMNVDDDSVAPEYRGEFDVTEDVLSAHAWLGVYF